MMRKEDIKAEIDAAIKMESPSTESQRSVQDKLVEIALQKCVLFHTDEEKAFVTYNRTEMVQEHWPVLGKEFQRNLGHWYYRTYGKAAKPDRLKEACEALAGMALYEGACHEVYLRTAVKDGNWYIDLCNEAWQVVEISSGGWRVLNQSPVHFIRSKTMKAFPLPVEGGHIDELWPFINVPKKDRLLLLAWIIESLRQDTQKPVLELLGGHGTGKSHLTEVIRSLIDPSIAPLRNFPNTEEAVFITSQNNWVLTFENQSHLTERQQDLMCQIATGSAYTKRTSHTDVDETVLRTLRPQIVNGITAMATRMDLADRTLSFNLEALPDSERKSKKQLEQSFNDAYPRILGALFQIIADALKELPSVHLDAPPRLVDFGYMGEAVGRVIGSPDVFMELLRANKARLITTSLESSPVCVALMKLCENSQSKLVFTGNYSSLLSRLEGFGTRGKGWVTSPKGLANALKRHESGLRQVGIIVTLSESRSNQGHLVRVEVLDENLYALSAPCTQADQSLSVHGEHSAHTGSNSPQGKQTERVI